MWTDTRKINSAVSNIGNIRKIYGIVRIHRQEDWQAQKTGVQMWTGEQLSMCPPSTKPDLLDKGLGAARPDFGAFDDQGRASF